MQIYLNALADGVLYCIMGLGLYISFRILRFADLTTEASFTTGAAVAVTLITNGFHPVIATLSAILGGMFAGLITGLLMTVFDIPSLLASIITMTGLYSVNLRIMQRPNINLRGFETIYSIFEPWIEKGNQQVFFVGAITVILLILLLSYFFITDIGQAVIATGDNEIMANSMGINTPLMKVFALMLANGLIGFCGAFIAQNNGFAEVSMGNGTVVIAMSSIVIGEVLLRDLKLPYRLFSIILGSVIYQLIIVFVLQLGLHSNDFRLISAVVMAIFLALPSVNTKIRKTYRLSREKGNMS